MNAVKTQMAVDRSALTRLDHTSVVAIMAIGLLLTYMDAMVFLMPMKISGKDNIMYNYILMCNFPYRYQ